VNYDPGYNYECTFKGNNAKLYHVYGYFNIERVADSKKMVSEAS
jgi:hypothetical protein